MGTLQLWLQWDPSPSKLRENCRGFHLWAFPDANMCFHGRNQDLPISAVFNWKDKSSAAPLVPDPDTELRQPCSRSAAPDSRREGEGLMHTCPGIVPWISLQSSPCLDSEVFLQPVTQAHPSPGQQPCSAAGLCWEWCRGIQPRAGGNGSSLWDGFSSTSCCTQWRC